MRRSKTFLFTVIITILVMIIAVLLKSNVLAEFEQQEPKSNIVYESVQDGDDAVYYEDSSGEQVQIPNLSFDAYFSVQGGNSKGVRGICSNLSETPDLNIVISATQFVDATIKNSRIEIRGKNCSAKFTTGASEDGLVKKILNPNLAELNDFQGGTSTILHADLSNNINHRILSLLSSSENKVIFTGNYVYKDENGNEIVQPFSKEVEFTIDWTGDLKLDTVSIEDYLNGAYIAQANDNYIVALKVQSAPDSSDQDMLINNYSAYSMGNLKINDVSPKSVSVTSGEPTRQMVDGVNYDQNADILTYRVYAKGSKNSEVVIDDEDADSYNLINQSTQYSSIVIITYSYKDIMNILNDEYKTKEYSVESYLVGFGNKQISYNMDEKGKIKTDAKTNSGTVILEKFTGEIITYENSLSALNKMNTRLAYSGKEVNTSFLENWDIQIKLADYYKKLEIKRDYTYNDNTSSMAFYNSVDNKYYSLDDYKYYTGINITPYLINMLGGEEKAKINIYSVDENGETKIHMYKNDGEKTGEKTIIDTITSSGGYSYCDENGNDISFKNIKLVINAKVENIGKATIINYVTLDNEAIVNAYTIDQFENFKEIHFSTMISGISSDEELDSNEFHEIKPGTNKVNYEDGKVSYGVLDAVQLSVLAKNQVLYPIELNMNRGSIGYWEKPTIIIELPEEITSVDDVSVGKIAISTSAEVKKASNGRIIIELKCEDIITKSTRLEIPIKLAIDKNKISSNMQNAEIRAFFYTKDIEGTNLVASNGQTSCEVGQAEDIYDIDSDNNTNEQQYIAITKVEYIMPTGVVTNTSISAEIDGKIQKETCPNVLEIKAQKTNKATVDVNVYNFYLETTITGLKVFGKIPYENNTYVLDNKTGLESTFSTTMTSEGITAPSNFWGEIYYTTEDVSMEKDKPTEIDKTIWQTKDEVNDWSAIKSYLIVFDDKTVNNSDINIMTFTYDINLPESQAFGEQSFATHAIEYTEQNPEQQTSILQQVETNKVGIKFQEGEKIKYADLALQKFVTNVDEQNITDRAPDVDKANLVDGTSTTATYTHTQEPLEVKTNQIVTYTLRIYNEGTEEAYASLIKDNIPDGLEFVTYSEGDGSINDIYGWKLVDENNNEVTDPSKAKYVVTNYLAKDEEAKNLIKAFDLNTMDELDFKDVQIQFKVTEPNNSARIITNYAQISDITDKDGNEITDRDSTIDKWIDDEDDQDMESVRALRFDLAINKYVTQAVVVENGQTVVTETGHKAEDNPESIVKVDLKKSKLNDVTVKFKYSIKVTNEGEIAGEATQIRDDIPQGLKFVAEDNPDWREENGQIVTNKLENTTLQPGESAEVEIILTWINDESNMGEIVNTAEINKDHNSYGTPDIDSTPGNKAPKEDDIDYASVMLTVKTGTEIIMYTSLTLGVIAIVGVGIVLIKGKVLGEW